MATLLGVLSDSHGRAAVTADAVAALVERGCDRLVHLGDVETDGVIDELVGHDATMVFGNCDWNADALARYAAAVGVDVAHPMGRLEIAGKQIAFTHGHLESLVRQALADRVDYLLFGHTHEVHDELVGPTRMINPGALFRARRYTAAVLDPAGDRLEIVEIPRRG